MKDHPFTSKNGIDCDWCPLPEKNQIHTVPVMDWGNDDGSHAFVTGWVMMALHKNAGDSVVQTATPVIDEQGNYTNVVRLTTQAGNVYDVTVTRHP